MVAFLVLLERKVLGGVQSRTGPLIVGWLGILQTLVDGVKLVSKGIFIFSLIGFFFFFNALYLSNVFNSVIFLGVLILLAYAFLGVVYLSSNLYSILRRHRAVVVMIGFDVVLLLLLFLDISLLVLLLGMFIFSAEGGRTPIDLVERESELVSGFNTEYGGLMFVLFFLGEYVVLIIFFHVYFGIEMNLLSVLLFIILIFRASYPRLKYVEVIAMFWRFFLLVLILFIV